MSISAFDMELQSVFKDTGIRNNGRTRTDPLDRDRADLLRLGKKPVLRVGLA